MSDNRPTIEQLTAIAEDYGGFCKACGAEAYGVEPDARDYPCEECGAHKVFGAEELIMQGWCR